MEKYSDDFGIIVDEIAWEEDYEEVVRTLAAHLEQATGIVLTGWDSPARGGIAFDAREKYEDGHRILVLLRPNYVPESGDWGWDDYKEYTAIINVYGSNPDQVDELRKNILASKELGAILLHREIVKPRQPGDVVYSLKNTKDQLDG